MQRAKPDPFGARANLAIGQTTVTLYRLDSLAGQPGVDLDRLPYTIKVLLENVLRNFDGDNITEEDVVALARWGSDLPHPGAFAFMPARVLLQDFTGVPAVVDLAAMRSAMARLGGDPALINPLVPVDLVIDHSVQVDHYGSEDAIEFNENKEYERNGERYQFLRWAQQGFQYFRVASPGMGIVHQVNLEYLAKVVATQPDPFNNTVAMPGYPGWHRLPYDDGQWPGRARLGCGRN